MEEVSSQRHLRASNKVAVISGASSGLGEVFARRFAANGHDLVLVARRRNRLEQLSRELQEDFRIKADVCVVDLAKPQDVRWLATRIAELPSVEMLINNAGFGTMGDFSEVTLERHLQMVHVHCGSTVELTYAVLPKMLESGEGTIINVSSLAAFTLGPGQAMYNSTKAFVKSFSESLHIEVRNAGVHVQALCPGMTRTEFHDTEDFAKFDRSHVSKVLWMSAEDVVDESLRALKRKRAICVPGIKNSILASLFSFHAIRALAGHLMRKRPDH